MTNDGSGPSLELPPHQGSPPAPFHDGPESSIYHSWWPFDDKPPPMYHDSAPVLPPASFHGGPESPIHSAWWPFGGENPPTYHDSPLALPPASPHPEAAPQSPPTVVTDALYKKVTTIVAWGAVLGISAGAIYAVHKEIEDKHSPET